ncbi:unnamed protein product [Vitrella brassicaformis CCMP3155]|uniref:Uncharacterized protein n=1 Tax=Vitrella brassicaformis (strain CCMP3155) TaxID=1169540 RepID=A0A0G4FE31_VITBC|nr:unnamed protein product [Vitrella brassicaformis CCMP3155]|eukprot:CEM11431.1 unnamed protein product [Vitrella brassicaformis CCMP3155]
MVVDVLLARHVNLQGCMLMRLPHIPREMGPPSAETEQRLLSIYERFIQRDPTLATERHHGNYGSVVHEAAEVEQGCFSDLH